MPPLYELAFECDLLRDWDRDRDRVRDKDAYDGLEERLPLYSPTRCCCLPMTIPGAEPAVADDVALLTEDPPVEYASDDAKERGAADTDDEADDECCCCCCSRATGCGDDVGSGDEAVDFRAPPAPVELGDNLPLLDPPNGTILSCNDGDEDENGGEDDDDSDAVENAATMGDGADGPAEAARAAALAADTGDSAGVAPGNSTT